MEGIVQSDPAKSNRLSDGSTYRQLIASRSLEAMAKVSVFALYALHGVSSFPILTNGTKKPAGCWKKHQAQIPSRSEMFAWHKRLGFDIGSAIICGAVSQNLEVLDFDDGSLFEPWRKSVETIACRLPIVETPSHGYHVFYRSSSVSGNYKIAMDPNREKSVLIETRGQGGYVLSVDCPGSCHPTGRPYVQVSGPLIPAIPTINPDERKALWAAARAFDKRPLYQDEVEERVKQLRKEAYQSRNSTSRGELTPWEDFDIRGDWSKFLDGWTSSDGIHCYRPGKTSGSHSAKINTAKNGQEVLTVFSSNAGLLAPTDGEKSWSKSEAYAVLHHGGNKREAAKALREMGFGRKQR